MANRTTPATPLGRLFLAGYGNSEPPAFFARLRARRIDAALDVRINPHGREAAYTGQEFLNRLVTEGGVGRARWMPRLANSNLDRSGTPALVDATAIGDVVKVLRAGQNVAVICSCWLTERCHRRVIAQMVRHRLQAIEVVCLDAPFPRRERKPDPGPPAPRTDIGLDLEQHLARIDVFGVPATEITAHLTDAVSAWAADRGWVAISEMTLPFLVDNADAPGLTGRVDLYVARPGEQPDLIIEIDRTPKMWSAEKLRLAAASGYAVLWVRWGKAHWLTRPVRLPPEVEMVPVPLAPSVRDLRAASTMARLNSDSAKCLRETALDLSPSERALLIALAGGAGPAGLTRVLPGMLWELVDTYLADRRALVLALRYGRYSRALTLAATATALAVNEDKPALSRERIRQIEALALRSLNRRVRIATTGVKTARPGSDQRA